jgi:sRNA-binding carbon storage regulator CsrA
MGYLTLTRHEGEKIQLSIDPAVDTAALLQHLLKGGISIHVGEARGGKARISIEAPREMLVLREELSSP